jgi:hypothetical protein
MPGTLVITTLSDGTNSTSATNPIQGSAKAWVNFDGTGTPAIRASYNVSSITDNGTGDYTVNFTNAMTDANYAVVTSCSRASTTAQPSIAGPSFNGTYTTSAVQIFTMNDAGSLEDSFRCGVSIFR